MKPAPDNTDRHVSPLIAEGGLPNELVSSDPVVAWLELMEVVREISAGQPIPARVQLRTEGWKL